MKKLSFEIQRFADTNFLKNFCEKYFNLPKKFLT